MVMEISGSAGRTVRQIGQPVRLEEETRIRNLGHAPGTDTEEVLSELGLSREMIDQLTPSPV
jgi:crotonobetainyl-CoA:carnitine CoA-transferase CaiB-like acyl-CoA transferase